LSKSAAKLVLTKLVEPSLETGTALDVALSGIFALIMVQVCDGGTGKMWWKRWERDKKL